MSKLFFIPLLLITSLFLKAQNVGIGTTSPKASAALEISSTNKGLLIPRISSSDRTGIAAPAKGLMVYDTTHSAFFYYDGGRWRPVYEKNYDSSSIDYSSVNGASLNLPVGVGGITNIGAKSGFIYDDGGPTGNYSPNNSSFAQINFDDSTLLIKIIVEEMDAETNYDSLLIIQFNGIGYLDTIGVFTGTQKGTVMANRNVRVYFKTNNTNQFAGFKIRWGRLHNSGALQTPTPLYGWHYNNAKLAAMGGLQLNNNWHIDSVGFGSLSYGIGTKAKGISSFAVGNIALATGQNSTAIGYNTKANGENSTALGAYTQANGISSTALGFNAIATSNYSTAMGFYTTALGGYSTAMGNYTTASGSYSTAMGNNTTAEGLISTAMGSHTYAPGDYATTMGSYTDAAGDNATAMGYYTRANGYASLVIGMFNQFVGILPQSSASSTTPLFMIGNGNGNTSNDRSNAMVVLKNGNVAIGDNLNPVNKLHITGTISNVSLLDGSGMMTIGYTSSTNLVVDQNDLQVRLSGAASDLYLQRLGGNIGIGNTGTPAYQLELSTNSAGKPGTNTWSIASDSRLKQNVNPYTQGLQQLLQIKPVTYHYNEKSGFDTKPEYVGIIAQDLQKIAPYMVSTVKRKDAEYLSVDNGAMTYMLINAVKEQQEIIETLKKRIEILEKK